MTRSSHRLTAHATDRALETRARCQDDDHPPGVHNPWMDVTFCHCGRIHYPGHVERVRWPDDEARLTDGTTKSVGRAPTRQRRLVGPWTTTEGKQ